MKTSEYAGLDYETYSDVELGGPDGKGLPNYIASPNFRVLCASVSVHGSRWTIDWVFNCVWFTDSEGNRRYQKCFLDEASSEMERFFALTDETLIAVNAGFERAVTRWLFPDFDPFRFQDAAVDARICGVESKLEVASRQMSVTSKLTVGVDLIQLFCVPNEYYPNGPTAELIEKNGHIDEWLLFIEYCEVDAKAGVEIRLKAHEILDRFDDGLIEREAQYERLTWQMNQNGWAIDMPLVKKMKLRSWANSIIAQQAFVVETGDGVEPINFRSHQQLRAFCEKRGVKYKSLDKHHLPGVLSGVKKRIAKLEESKDEQDPKTYPSIERGITMLKEVEALLETKLEIGGSMLTKLPVILNLVSEDGILRDQYMHVGAPQTYRSTGRGVQMQNLAKLKMEKDAFGNEVARDISTLYDLGTHWSNGDMANNLRQVFVSRHPQGKIIVGDFAGVESRGLAFEAGETWKLDAFRQGLDVYKVLVTRFIPGLEYDAVTPDLRPRGKYSELSCGYQASGKAVQDFMFRLGFSVTIEDATQNVEDWRRACPAIVDYWDLLDDAIKTCVRSNQPVEEQLANGLSLRITPFTMESVTAIRPGALSVCVQLLFNGAPYVTRFVHGLYFYSAPKSKMIKLCYYKPAERLNEGALWRETYNHKELKDEKGKPLKVRNSIYGGKLAGILTQSMCREMMFESLAEYDRLLRENGVTNALICGQFHDEINTDWWPEEGGHSEEFVMELKKQAMTTTTLTGFPLDVEVKSAYRYIK